MHQIYSLTPKIFFIALGLGLSLCGWKFYSLFFRVFGFLIGFIIGSLISPIIAANVTVLIKYEVVVFIITGLIFGIICSLLSRMLKPIFIFIAGIFSGILIKKVLFDDFNIMVIENTKFMIQIFIDNFKQWDSLAGVIGGITFVIFEKIAIVLFTSSLGALVISLTLENKWLFSFILAFGILFQFGFMKKLFQRHQK